MKADLGVQLSIKVNEAKDEGIPLARTISPLEVPVRPAWEDRRPL